MSINRLTRFKCRKVSRLSPSQFHALTQCPYKMVLAESLDRKPLLPCHPSAYMGAVIHKMIELITRGKVSDEQQFNTTWDALIQEKEAELAAEGITFCLPLLKNVQNIGMKKIQVKHYLQSKQSDTFQHGTARFWPEKWLEDKDGKMGGKADLIVENGDWAAIYDFKTGKITEEAVDEEGSTITQIKTGYAGQLKLYAHLYFLCKGRYPAQLCLVDLNKQLTHIPFSADECKDLYNEAVRMMDDVNQQVECGTFDSLARCSESSCRGCLYRPACHYYKEWLDEHLLTNDLIGVLLSMQQFNNGNVNVTVGVNGRTITIAGFDKALKGSLETRLGKKIELYNLKRDNSSTHYIAAKYSCIYDAIQH